MISSTITPLRRVLVAAIAVFLGSLSLQAKTDTILDSPTPTSNPANASPPNVIVGPGDIGLNTNYTLRCDVSSTEKGCLELGMYAWENDYSTNNQYVKLNGGNPKYMVYGDNETDLLQHAWTCKNQAYGHYYWSDYAEYSDGTRDESSLFGSYNS